jgi:hypothetical protein
MGGDSDIEDHTVDCEIAPHLPAKQAPSKLFGIKPAAFEKGIEEAEGLGAVIGPRAWRHAFVSTVEARRRLILDLMSFGDFASRVELIRHA